MATKFLIFFYFCCSALRLAVSQTADDLPICVVGAGISGLNLGILLQQIGYKVEVFDKQARVGGKVDTFRIGDEVLVEMCPLFFTNSGRSLRKYIDQFQLTSIPYNQSDRLAFDPYSGVILPYPSYSAEQQQELATAVQRFIGYRSQYTNQFDFGYLHATPDLSESMEQWLVERNLTALLPMFELVFTVEGYGALQDTPALYLLKLFDVEYFMEMLDPAGSFYTLYEGLSVLVNKMASLLHHLHVNHEVLAIFRQENQQTILLRNGYSIQRRICRKTILAFPPLLHNLQRMIFDLSRSERSVLSEVKIARYATAAHHLPSLMHDLYAEGFTLSANHTPIEGAPVGNGEITALVKQSTRKLPDVYSSYSWIRGDYDRIATAAELYKMSKNMHATLSKMSAKRTTLHAIKTSEYFPHVTPQSITEGFFRKFNAIQGMGGLYYASNVLAFETMDHSLQMSQAFVKMFFNGPP